MKEGSIFMRKTGEKRNGGDTRRRRSLCRLIISGNEIHSGGYEKEILNLRQVAEDCLTIEHPTSFFYEGPAIDTIFSYAYEDGFLTPSEQADFAGAWLYLKGRWNL